MKLAIAVLTVLAIALPAQAASGHRVRVTRPSQGAGSHVTYVQIIKGVVPHRMRATVLTDTRCSPDAMGFSHCLNKMRLANGRTVTAVHKHRMMDMPCLDPGEHVILTP